MRFDQKLVVAISKLAGAHSTLYVMVLTDGPGAYQLYRENRSGLRTTFELLAEYLEIEAKVQFPTTKKAWLAAKTSLAIDDARRRKEARKGLRERYGPDAVDLYKYSLLISDYLWLKPMGWGGEIPEAVPREIRERSLDYGVGEKAVEEFLAEPTPERSVELQAALVDYFNVVSWFISYAHEDEEFVDALVDVLEMDRVRIWRDTKSTAAGDVLADSIQESIQRSDIFSVVLSGSSSQSEWVAWECKMALEWWQSHGRPRIVPVVLENAEVPSVLVRFRVADFSKTFDVGMSGIIAAIEASEPLTTE